MSICHLKLEGQLALPTLLIQVGPDKRSRKHVACAGAGGQTPKEQATAICGMQAGRPAQEGAIANGDDNQWHKLPKTKGKKAKGKGQKADATMLGFKAGINYNLLEQPE